MHLIPQRTRWAARCVCLGLWAAAAQAATWSDGSDIRPPTGLAQVSRWERFPERRWAGPSIWCNRLQDWTVRHGRLVADNPAALPCRTAHLLTHQLGEKREPFQLSVVLRVSRSGESSSFAGFLVGAGEGRLDYRGAALVHHLPGKGGGLLAVLDTGKSARLVFRDMSAETNSATYPVLEGGTTVVALAAESPEAIQLTLEGVPSGGATYTLRLSARDVTGGALLGAAELPGVVASKLLGNVALASHGAVHSFERFHAGGGRLEHRPERAFGPVAGTLYSVSNGVLKLSAQFVPTGAKQNFPTTGGTGRGAGVTRLLAELQRKSADGTWQRIAGPEPVIGPDYYVPFRVEHWDATRDTEARVLTRDLDGTSYEYAVRIARDPVDQPVVSVAGFTGMGSMGRIASTPGPAPKPGAIVIGRWTPANVWAPFADAVRILAEQKVDILAFTGDQIYEGKPTPADDSIEPIEDYLYRWLMWHWSFGSLTRRLPSMVQPDDHDVYQGNIWGWSGRLNQTGFNGDGGFMRSPHFVNLVYRTQTGHLPDPYDPVPAHNGIVNYFTTFHWGGVGLAVLEDRKFKTPPQITNPEDQQLLGEKQERMLREWGENWSGHQVKCAVSQTIYASLHVGFQGDITRDADTNGFPKHRRDEVVRLLRRCGAFLLGGDQHLSTLSQVGIESPTDGFYQFSVPAMGNIFWRWFYPKQPGQNPLPEAPDYTGDFRDGFGNAFRMLAVANPERRSLLNQELRQRSLIPEEEARRGLGDDVRASQGDGYGIVRFDKPARAVTIESWPYRANPRNGDRQFAGWPKTVSFDALDGRQAVAWLPDLDLSAAPAAVVQIADEATGTVIKATRATGATYSPPVFQTGSTYTITAGDPEKNLWWTARGLKPALQRGATKLRVELNPVR